MPNSRHEQSPFNGERFLMRDDSRAWPAESNDAQKSVRFASTGDCSVSAGDDPRLPPPRPSKGFGHPLLSIVFGTLSLGIALLLPLLRMGLVALPSQYGALLGPSDTWLPTESPVDISPVLHAAIEDFIVTTIRAHQLASRGSLDFALKANGGRVVPHLTSPGSPGFLAHRDDDPSVAIDDDVHAGRCWEFHALPSQLGVRLPYMVHLSHITVEHLPKGLAADFGQAPRNMTLWGVVDGKQNREFFRQLSEEGYVNYGSRTPLIAKDFVWAPLASFLYDIHGADPVQTFPVLQPYLDKGLTFGIVVLEILDNWGSSNTCLYRMRIHGKLV